MTQMENPFGGTTASDFPAELMTALTAFQAAEAKWNAITTRKSEARALVESQSAALTTAEAEKAELLRGQALHGTDAETSGRLAKVKARIVENSEALADARAALATFDGLDSPLWNAAEELEAAHHALEAEARAFARREYGTAKTRFDEIVRPLLAEILAWNRAAGGELDAFNILDGLNLRSVKPGPAPFTLPQRPHGLPRRPQPPQRPRNPWAASSFGQGPDAERVGDAERQKFEAEEARLDAEHAAAWRRDFEDKLLARHGLSPA